jgi:Iron-containing alcohol dehydrogenase
VPISSAVFHGSDIEARSAMLLGSMLAGRAFANSPGVAVHALAYPIGGTFHVPHGLSNALVLPHVLRFNVPEAASLYAEIAADAFPYGHMNNVVHYSLFDSAVMTSRPPRHFIHTYVDRATRRPTEIPDRFREVLAGILTSARDREMEQRW